jgi:signal transduction histidine kinase
MRVIISTVSILLASMIFVCSAAIADDKADAVKMVKDAVAFYKGNGMEKTLDVLNDPKGQFIKGNLYVFAYDLSGTMMANVAKPELVGQNVIDVPDSDGKKFRQEIIDTAKKSGSGWVDYKTIHPKTKLIEQKTSYFERIDELVLSCGIYKK